MSAFELPLEHLRVLVLAGHRLGVAQVVKPDGSIVPLDLGTFDDRSWLLDHLRAENRSALGRHTPDHDGFFSSHRDEPWPNPPIDSPKDAAQVVQWVRCYQYQSSGSPTWLGSIAQIYCALLTARLLDRVSQLFRLSWAFELQAGPKAAPLVGPGVDAIERAND
jgi:hypothetical protein